MKIHFITEGESSLQSLVAALSPVHEVSESGSVSEISQSTEAVVIGEHVSPTHPQWQQAQALGLPIYSYGAFLYESHKMKTRVVIAGTQGRSEIAAMVLHTMDYFSKKIDYFLESPIGKIPTCKYSPEAEFVLIAGNRKHIVHKLPRGDDIYRRVGLVACRNKRKRIWNVQFVIVRTFCSKRKRSKPAVMLKTRTQSGPKPAPRRNFSVGTPRIVITSDRRTRCNIRLSHNHRRNQKR